MTDKTLFMREDEEPEAYAAMVRLAARENDALLRADAAEARAREAEAKVEELKAVVERMTRERDSAFPAEAGLGGSHD